jgi:hypothetical protein
VSTTRYFNEQVLRKRPYLTIEMCRQVLAHPLRSETQEGGRIRHWGEVTLPGEESRRILRIITLEDGVTLHNAFVDRSFRRDEQ